MQLKKAHRHIGLVLIVALVLGLGLFAFLNRQVAAVTDTCASVNTTFTADAPSSVVAGKSFSITNITVHPDASYGFNVTDSTLSLSASKATPSSYTKHNTSTDPSPTTGAPTYTAYFPKYTLKAGNDVGSTITVKLVSASATVEGVGVITCDELSATLATIKITALASSGGSTSADDSTSSSSNDTDEPTAEKKKEEATATDETAATEDTATTPTGVAANSESVEGDGTPTSNKIIVAVISVFALVTVAGGTYYLVRGRTT